MKLAIYRNVSLTFWTDRKVTDEFTPEDRYFFLYLLTNTHTNLCGCYEIGYKQMARETGYNEETVKRLVERMHKEHGVVDYDESTKEILIWNWHKYNWSKSKDLVKGVKNASDYIKSNNLRSKILYVLDCFEQKKQVKNRPSIDGGETSVSVYTADSVSVTVTDTVNNKYISYIKTIIDYLNNILGTKYKYNTRKTKDCIIARLNEGFTVDDFKCVIDKKSKQWMDDKKMSAYLRPETLFGNKFEGYLNEIDKKEKTVFDEWMNA